MKSNTKGIIAIIIIAFATFGFLFWLYGEMKPFTKPDINMVMFNKETLFTTLLRDDVKAFVIITIIGPIIDINDLLRMRREIRKLLYDYTSDQIVSSSIAIIEKLRPIRDRSTMDGLTFLIRFIPENGELFILEF